MVNCRWMTSFFGLAFDDSSSCLIQMKKRVKVTDVHVIDLSHTFVLLQPSDLNDQAEQDLLARVIKGAHVASAHAVREGTHSLTGQDVDNASQLLFNMVQDRVYKPLNRPMPAWK